VEIVAREELYQSSKRFLASIFENAKPSQRVSLIGAEIDTSLVTDSYYLISKNLLRAMP
jgi:hypothetical protein